MSDVTQEIGRLKRHAEMYSTNGYPDAAKDLNNQIDLLTSEYQRIQLDYQSKMARLNDKTLKLIIKHKACL